MRKPTSILFITLTNIGDVVLSTTLLNALLKDYPDAQVDVVCGAKSAVLFKDFPNLRSLHAVKKMKHHMHHLKVIQKFWGNKYDVVVDLRTALTGYIMRGKTKIMFKKDDRLHRAEQIGRLWPSKHEVSQVLWLNPALEATAKERYQSLQKPIIAWAPTANWDKKQWPQERFMALFDALEKTKEFKGATYMLLGAPHETPQVEKLLKHIPEERLVNLYQDAKGLDDVQAQLAQADYFIGNDSGLAHIAAALNVPTLTLFGPTPDCLYRPYGHKSHVVIAPDVPYEQTGYVPPTPSRVIDDIQVEDVLSEFLRMYKLYNKEKEAV